MDGTRGRVVGDRRNSLGAGDGPGVDANRRRCARRGGGLRVMLDVGRAACPSIRPDGRLAYPTAIVVPRFCFPMGPRAAVRVYLYGVYHRGDRRYDCNRAAI